MPPVNATNILLPHLVTAKHLVKQGTRQTTPSESPVSFSMDNASLTTSVSSNIHDDTANTELPLSLGQGQIQESHAGTKSYSNVTPNSKQQPVTKTKSESAPVCRFFASKKGCRAGKQCPYRHVPEESKTTRTDRDDGETTVKRSAANIAPKTSRPSKPTSAREQLDPREFQISQVIRRFRPFRADLDDGLTTLKFSLTPTDPDFPFELEGGLSCVLKLPRDFPQNGKAQLEVQNSEMARGFQINVEQGFENLAVASPHKTLLALLNDLDKNLEKFLTATKAATVKLVANRKPPSPAATPAVLNEGLQTQVTTEIGSYSSFENHFSSRQIQEASVRREQDVRQLEARLGRHNLFSRSEDGVAFSVPLTIWKPELLPKSLGSLRETALIVPKLYPLEPCSIVLKGVGGQEAENVESNFEKRVAEHGSQSLMAHMNYLSQNIAKMAQQESKPPPQSIEESLDEKSNSPEQLPETMNNANDDVYDIDRPHLHYIPGPPPEWTQPQRQAEDNPGSQSDEGTEEESADDLDGGANLPTQPALVEKGVAVSFPDIDLNGIELLQLTTISLVVKCDRCKELVDIKEVKPTNGPGGTRVARTEPCTKCTATFGLEFHSQPMFATSHRAGSLDLQSCTAVELLPSNFQPTCSSCSTPFPVPPGLTAVRGDTRFTNCRECHARMTFGIPQVKFLQISSGLGVKALPDQKRVKERLDVRSGRPLPRYGRCTHYSRSYRWFRFSCCNKVYACDQCHDLAQKEAGDAHPSEHAERMLCGWCSREQRYDPERCKFCRNSLVKRAKGWYKKGFWEGGKGVRERGLMHQNDPRKFKHKQEMWTGDKVPERIRKGPKGGNEPPEGWSERFRS